MAKATYIQIFVGGGPIDHEAIEASGATQMFGNDVDDWNLPPTPPQSPGAIKAANLPTSVKQVLAKAMSAKLSEVTGFKVTVKV